MGRRQAVRHSTLTAAFTGSNPVGLVGENMLEKPILLTSNKENSPASKRSEGGGMNPLQENCILQK